MKRVVVIIDDETVAIRYYIEALRASGFETHFASEPKDIRILISGTGPVRPHFFIVDLMMPIRELYPDEPDTLSFYTGLLVGRDIRVAFPNTPILILSNTTVPLLQEAAGHFTAETPLSLFASKMETDPFDLVRIVATYFVDGNLKLPPEPPGFWQRLWSAVTLKATIAGVGIDLKKLANDNTRNA